MANWVLSVIFLSVRALQVIAICETKEEDEESQILFWRSLNAVMENCGQDPPDFAGFMSDEAGANWLAIRTVYNGGARNVMEGRERSCLFHWEQSLQKYTKKLVPVTKQRHHIEMCEAWRLANTIDLAASQSLVIRNWWVANVANENIKALERWLKWWERRIAHWGVDELHVSELVAAYFKVNIIIGVIDVIDLWFLPFVQANKSPWERAQIPSINFSESVHASWLSGEGGRRKISLYDACVTDVLNAYIQCAKRLGFMTGRYIGSGPSMDAMMSKADRQQTPSPGLVARVVQCAAVGSPMYEEPHLHGDRETVQRKKRGIAEALDSHRPEYIMESRQRKPRGRPRQIRFCDKEQGNTYIQQDVEEIEGLSQGVETPTGSGEIPTCVEEVDVAREQWALRRMPSNCIRKCFGMVDRKNCNSNLQSRVVGLVAPCFWSERSYKDKTISQWLWFCNHDVNHTKAVKKQVNTSPLLPTLWPVARGTNVSLEELYSLRQAGFQIPNCAAPLRPSNPPLYGEGGSNSRKRRKWRHGISKDAQKRLEAANNMVMTFLEEVTETHKHHVVFRVLTETSYDVHIKEEPSCTCPDFQKRESAQKAFLACKHMYYVYVKILGLQPNEHMAMHQSTLTPTDIAFMLAQPRKVNSVL